MIEDVPKDDPEDFIEFVRAHQDGQEGLAEYLELLYEDYYDGNLVDGDRYYTMQAEDGGEHVRVGRLIDVAVLFGMAWERDDPWEGDDDGT